MYWQEIRSWELTKITKEKMPWSYIKFSPLILKGNVWRPVWRICMLILGLKGLSGHLPAVPEGGRLMEVPLYSLFSNKPNWYKKKFWKSNLFIFLGATEPSRFFNFLLFYALWSSVKCLSLSVFLKRDIPRWFICCFVLFYQYFTILY